LEENIEKRSEILGRECIWKKSSKVTSLPYYLTVQFVRFFWKQDVQVKAKIVKPVEFPFVLDLHDVCSDELKAKLAPKRKIYHDNEDKRLEQVAKKKKEEGKEEETKEDKVVPMEVSNDPSHYVNETGMYELFAVLTHKGRMADGGHYVAWVKESGDNWLKFDDDKVSPCKSDEIKKLSGKGGGDWHMAYLCLYRTIST